jgi:hypothetical protein
MKLGLKITKVHRTISFREEAWLKPYINFNTIQRTKAKTDFEKDIWKLMNNAFYGKTVENIRKRKNIEVVSVEKRAQNLYNKPTFIREKIFSNNLTAIHHRKTSITFNKPIYIGMCVLDLSKLLMYEFYYDTINELWPSNEILNFDTDSFFLNIQTEDLYEDMKKIQDKLDPSDYPKDHFLRSEENKKVIGKFKDEMMGEVMNEIACLRAKQYAFSVEKSERLKSLENQLQLCDGNEKKRLKGISKTIVKKEIKFDDYKNSLLKNGSKRHKQYQINSKNHNMYLNKVNKKSLTPFDDKRYILEDNVTTYPFGFEEIKDEILCVINE